MSFVDQWFGSALLLQVCASLALGEWGASSRAFCLLRAPGPELDLAFPGLSGSAASAQGSVSCSQRFGQQPNAKQLWSLTLGPPV